MIRSLLLLPVFASALAGTALGASSTTYDGKPLSADIGRCGITVETAALTSVRPFLEATTAIRGQYRLSVTRQSGAGTAASSQSGEFTGPAFTGGSIAINGPGSARVALTMTGRDATPLCTLDVSFTIGAAN
jgi:hypothetical protein